MTIDALLGRADMLLKQNRPKEAEKELQQVMQQEPDNDVALSMLCRCKYDVRQYTEGVHFIKEAIRIEPHEGYYFYLLAFGYYQLNDRTSAKKHLQRAIELAPYIAEFYGLAAMILLEENRFEDALEKANEGLAVDAENISCLNARGTALNKLRRVDDAMATMQDALEQDPENPFTHTTIGWNLLEKGRHKEAGNHFREALRIYPNLEGARNGLKESMKSTIAPYRWLLQYSFWVNNKGRNVRWMMSIGLLFAVQLVNQLTKTTTKPGLVIAGNVIIGLYLLLVFTSWLINPLANFFLIFYKDGKYALTSNEKWNAICTVSAMLAGIGVLLFGLTLTEPAQTWILMAGLSVFSLALPLGYLRFPVRFRNNNLKEWFNLGVLAAGIITAILFFLGSPAAGDMSLFYLFAFVAYTWLGIFSRK